jgi:hypothetical protein
MSDIERAYKALVGKLAEYNLLFQYADGEQPLIYSTAKLQATFKNLNARFQQNWISVIVDSALDRLAFKGWSSEDTAIVDGLALLFDQCQIAIEADDAHEGALITHEAFIIVWKDDEDGIQVYYNDPRMCHVFYDSDNPKKKEFAAKWYVDQEKKYHMVLYYPEKIEYYVSETVKNGVPKNAAAFKVEEETKVNPFNEIPVFHFRTDRRGKNSDITNVLTLQDAINKLLADMMVAAEFAAYRQRWIITNADTSGLKNGANEIWSIPAGDGVGQQSQVGEFPESNLTNFLNSIDKLANSIAIISRTPKHYFYSTGSNISGEALLAMESPLVAKVERHQKNFGVTWMEIGSFLGKLSGIDVPKDKIKLVWEPAQAVQPLTEAQTIKTNVEATVPLESALRWSGKNEFEIQKIMKEVEKANKDKMTFAKAELERLRLETEQSNEQPDGSGGDQSDGDQPNME